MLASAPLFALAARSEARESVILKLIKAAHEEHEHVAPRVDFIAGSLVGARYQAHTLIGGPRRPELFVTRDDAFDCVTYCEVVLSAALSKDFTEYTQVLKRIRYAKGDVVWAERNHDLAQWNRNIVGNKICRPVQIGPAVTVEKALDGSGLGKRRYAITASSTAAMMANQKALQAGDVVGFVSRRSELDFFHCGFIAFGKSGTLMLRHASQSHGRVVDEEMTSFIAKTGVKYVTLLRAQEPEPAAS